MYNFDKYIELGFENREDYLNSVALDYDLPYEEVYSIANTLGEEEDFDGLIDAVEDYVNMLEESEYYDNYEDDEVIDDLIPVEDDVDFLFE